MKRFEQMVIAMAEVVQGLASMATFCYWRPSITVDARMWHLLREAKRVEEGK